MRPCSAQLFLHIPRSLSLSSSLFATELPRREMLQLAVCRVAVAQPQDIFICAWGHLKFHYVRWLIKQRLHLLLCLCSFSCCCRKRSENSVRVKLLCQMLIKIKRHFACINSYPRLYPAARRAGGQVVCSSESQDSDVDVDAIIIIILVIVNSNQDKR